MTEKTNEHSAAEIPLAKLASVYIKDNFSKTETIAAKKNDLGKFLAFLEKSGVELLEELGRMSPAELNDLCGQFLNMRGERGDGLRTLQRRLSTIRSFLNHLTETQTWILPVAPALKHVLPNRRDFRSSAPTITYEEWIRLKEQLRQARNPQIYPLACLAIMGGGRTYAECRNMVWSDIDFDAGTIMVRKGKYANYLELVPELKKILLAFKGTKRPDKRLFMISQQVLNKTLKVYARRAGINDAISFMSFRASFIKWAGERDKSLNEMLKATMHKSGQTMRSYYEYSRQVIPLSPILKTDDQKKC